MTPFIKTCGLNISDKKEPETRQYELLKIIEEAVKNEYDYIEKFGIDNFEDYYNITNDAYRSTLGCSITTSKE